MLVAMECQVGTACRVHRVNLVKNKPIPPVPKGHPEMPVHRETTGSRVVPEIPASRPIWVRRAQRGNREILAPTVSPDHQVVLESQVYTVFHTDKALV